MLRLSEVQKKRGAHSVYSLGEKRIIVLNDSIELSFAILMSAQRSLASSAS